MLDEKPAAWDIVRGKVSAVWEWVVDVFYSLLEASKDVLGL